MRAQGRRARRGPIAVVYVASPSGAVPGGQVDAPRVGYAIGRRVGGAVVRNRIRRRLRAALEVVAELPDSPLVPGAYLVSAGLHAADLPFSELVRLLEVSIRAAAGSGSSEEAQP